MALNSLICADVPLRNCSLTQRVASDGSINARAHIFPLVKVVLMRETQDYSMLPKTTVCSLRSQNNSIAACLLNISYHDLQRTNKTLY